MGLGAAGPARHTPGMETFHWWQTLPTVGMAIVLALMLWVLIDLARLRRHPDFSSPFAGSLRLHLMALGMSVRDLDKPTRDRILSIRRRILAALVIFAVSAIAIGIMTAGAAPPR